MKKLLLFMFLFLVVPVWALCPISEGENVCTISNSIDKPLFQNPNINDTKAARKNINNNFLQTKGQKNSFSQTQNQSGIKMQGSLGCQFGNCETNENTNFLNNY